MEYLLIGGSRDGCRIDVEECLNTIEMHKLMPASSGIHNICNVNASCETELYLKEQLRGQYREFYMFRHSDISVDEMMDKLICNYKSVCTTIKSKRGGGIKSL